MLSNQLVYVNKTCLHIWRMKNMKKYHEIWPWLLKISLWLLKIRPQESSTVWSTQATRKIARATNILNQLLAGLVRKFDCISLTGSAYIQSVNTLPIHSSILHTTYFKREIRLCVVSQTSYVSQSTNG